jgi:hypothetical protein
MGSKFSNGLTMIAVVMRLMPKGGYSRQVAILTHQVHRREAGKIWLWRERLIFVEEIMVQFGGRNQSPKRLMGECYSQEGCSLICSRFLISISNSNVGLAGQSRHIPFTKIAFSNRGTWFIATDHFGVMYCFDIRKNK